MKSTKILAAIGTAGVLMLPPAAFALDSRAGLGIGVGIGAGVEAGVGGRAASGGDAARASRHGSAYGHGSLDTGSTVRGEAQSSHDGAMRERMRSSIHSRVRGGAEASGGHSGISISAATGATVDSGGSVELR